MYEAKHCTTLQLEWGFSAAEQQGESPVSSSGDVVHNLADVCRQLPAVTLIGSSHPERARVLIIVIDIVCSVIPGKFVSGVEQRPAGQPAMEARPGLATVHCCSRVLSTVEFRGATTSLQK